MRIVIFSCNYPPLINPRSFRVDNFVKSLNPEQDYLVFTSYIVNNKTENNKIIRCGRKINPDSTLKSSFKKYSLIRFFHKLYWPDLYLFDSIIYLLHYLFRFRQKEDQIVTVSHPFSTHFAGLIVKKFYGQHWTADIGDIFYHNKHHSFFSRFYEKAVLLSADVIVVNAISLRDYFVAKYSLDAGKFEIRPNGLHIDVTKIQKTPSSHLRLSYIGNTYEDIRDALEEMKILVELVINYPDLKIRIQLFGTQHYNLLKFAALYPGLIHICNCKNEDELISAYSNTDILINFANKNYPGVPSKLEEYAASGLPVINFIHLVSDASVQAFDWKDLSVLHFQLKSGKVNTLFDYIKSHS